MRRVRLVSLSALALAIAGCDERSPANDRGTVHDGYPKTVELGTGQDFVVPDRPTRIVCATTTAVDYALSLCSPDRVVGVCNQAYESSILRTLAAEDPTLRERLDRFDRFVVESALRSEPDLILCSAFSNPSTVETLRRTRVPLLQLVEPATIDGCLTHLEALGRVFDTEPVASGLVSDLRRRIASLRAERPGDGRSALWFAGTGVEGWSSGNGTLQHDALSLVGLENAIGARLGPVAVSLDDLLRLDPEFLIIPSGPDGEASTTRAGLNDPRLRGLRAVPDHVIEIDDALFQTTSHRIVDACEAIARSLR